MECLPFAMICLYLNSFTFKKFFRIFLDKIYNTTLGKRLV